MLSVLLNDILPVFAMLALGFAMGRTGKASTGEATAINRIAFIVLQPALIYPLIAGIDFSNFDWHAGDNDVPLIHNCLARFECTRHAIHEGGDHAIIVGRVTAAAISDGTPLLFARGAYGRFTDRG